MELLDSSLCYKPSFPPHYVHIVQNVTLHNLENIDQEKNIGVIMDSNLEFVKQIHAKINKTNLIFSIIRRSFRCLNPQNFTPLYTNRLVHSHIHYDNYICSPYKQKHITPLRNAKKEPQDNYQTTPIKVIRKIFSKLELLALALYVLEAI